MLLLQLAGALFAAAVLLVLFISLHNVISTRLVLAKCQREHPKINWQPELINWLSGHMDLLSARRNVQNVHKSHEKHGQVVGFVFQGLKMVSLTDLDAIKRAIIDKASVNVNRIQIGLPMSEIELDCIFTCENEQWRRVRRSFAPALRPARFRSANVESEIGDSINKLLGAIERKLQSSNSPSAEFDLEDLIRRYSLQIVLGCLYKQYDLINFNLDEKCRWVEMVDHGLNEMRDNRLFRWALLLPPLRHLVDWLSWNLHPIGEWRRSVLEFLKQQSLLGLEARKQLGELSSEQQVAAAESASQRLRDGSEYRRNMLDSILDQFHAGKLTPREFFNSSFLLFGAADKTASDSLVFTLYQLGVRQDVQQKLRNSLRAKPKSTESAPKQAKPGQDYLSWVINESLRLNPPGPIGASRTLVEPLELGHGRGTLEPGTVLITPVYTLHRLTKYWGEDAHGFRPERWAELEGRLHAAQFMPFGAGLRGCPGKEFALHQMKLLVAALVARYKLECQVKADIGEFDSPLFIFNIQQTPVSVKLTRLGAETAAA